MTVRSPERPASDRACASGGYYINLNSAPPNADALANIVGRKGYAEFDPDNAVNVTSYIKTLRAKEIEPIGYLSVTAGSATPFARFGVTHARTVLPAYPKQHMPLTTPGHAEFVVRNIERLAKMGFAHIKLDDIDTIKGPNPAAHIKAILDLVERRNVSTPDGRPVGILWINAASCLDKRLAEHPRVHGFQAELEEPFCPKSDAFKLARLSAGTSKPVILIGFTGNNVCRDDLARYQRSALQLSVPVTAVLAKGASTSISGDALARLPLTDVHLALVSDRETSIVASSTVKGAGRANFTPLGRSP